MKESDEMVKELAIASFDKVIPDLEVRVQIVNCILESLTLGPLAAQDSPPSVPVAVVELM